jgi:ABC-2 type transport system ATP-binding protein
VAEPIIQLVDLTKKYGDFTAVDHLNLTIEKGEIFGLLGPNGAGKSTAILMMLGLTEPSSGLVKVCGINSTVNPIEVKKRVGYLPEDVGFYDDLSGIENLIYTARLNSIPEQEAVQQAEQLLLRVGLGDVMNKKTGKYSRGMRQRLGLADVLVKNPEVIILDEPTSGIDPKGVQDFLHLIVELRDEHGINVLFSSHNLHQVQQVCDRVGIFVEGRLLAVGDIHSLSQELFTAGMYQIEIGLDNNSFPENGTSHEQWLQELLAPIEGIEKIVEQKNFFEIQCTKDLSVPIAKKIVESGVGLSFLNRQEYGLDAIYNRYFEGGTNYE